jgi:hypothetical protein
LVSAFLRKILGLLAQEMAVSASLRKILGLLAQEMAVSRFDFQISSAITPTRRVSGLKEILYVGAGMRA